MWNLRLEFGHQLQPDPIRTISRLLQLPPRLKPSLPTPAGMANQRWPWPSRRIASLGRILCSSLMVPCVVLPTNLLWPMNDEERADGSLRVVYGASIRSCRPCPLREQCQWNGGATAKPRLISVLLHPLVVGSASLHRPGLESEGSSAGLLSPPSPPACRDPGRGWEWQGCCHTPCYSCAAFPC